MLSTGSPLCRSARQPETTPHASTCISQLLYRFYGKLAGNLCLLFLMSTTIPVSIDDWSPSDATPGSARPRFDNPVPALVESGGRFVGELDAFLQWEGDALLARLALPALPGHVVRASCRVATELDTDEDTARLWVRGIDVIVDHLEGSRILSDSMSADRTEVDE